MNNKILLHLFVFILTLHAIGMAQPFTVGGSISFDSPINPSLFRDLYKQDIGINGLLKWNFSSNTSIVINIAYQPVKADIILIQEEISKKLTLPSYIDSLEVGKFEVGMVSFNMMQYFHKKETGYRFFITAGVSYGYRKVNQTRFLLFLDSSETYRFDPKDGNQFGLNGGLGLEINLVENMYLYIQGVYHHLLVNRFELWNPRTGVMEVQNGACALITTSIGLLIDI